MRAASIRPVQAAILLPSSLSSLPLSLLSLLSLLFLPIFLLLLLWAGAPLGAQSHSAADRSQLFSRSVVQITSIAFNHSYFSPWEKPKINQLYGTGFIINGNQILTNAHVVSNAQIIRLQRPDQRSDFEARLLFVAHDCDLALLEVTDKRFFDNALPLEIGSDPQLNIDVEVIGFPIGGRRVSITRGVVSRSEVNLYSHSGVDYHLTVQVDAAINPGNSGGPALHKGKVIGVAFQTIQLGENLGYLIPPVVIRRFLQDIKDRHYNGYTEFGVIDMPTSQPILRQTLGLEEVFPSPDTGVLVYDIFPGSSAVGHLQRGDVLLSVNGKQITEKGDVQVGKALRPYIEVVDNLYDGDIVQVKLWRDKKEIELQFPSRVSSAIDFKRRNYEHPPAYLLLGGLLFQPLDADLMRTYRVAWSRRERSEIFYRYHHFIPGRIYEETDGDVVLTRRLPDPVNIYAENFLHRIVKSVNGLPVKNFTHFRQLLKQARRQGPRLVLDFHDYPLPLVFRLSDLQKAKSRVLKRHGIQQDQFPPLLKKIDKKR